LVNYPLVEIAHLWELLDQIPGTDDIGPEVILEDDEHDIGVRQSVAGEELSTIEGQPALKLTKLLWQCLFDQFLLQSSLLPLGGKKTLGDALKDPVDGEDDLVGLRLVEGGGAREVAQLRQELGDGHRLADHLPLVLQDWHRAIWQEGLYLAKLFTRKSDIVKLDASVCQDETGDLGAATGGEVGQPQLLRVARLHLQALAQTLSQFLDHFLSSNVSPN